MNKIKTAVYCRVSTEKESQLNSLSNQIEYFKNYINNSRNLELYKIYYDD